MYDLDRASANQVALQPAAAESLALQEVPQAEQEKNSALAAFKDAWKQYYEECRLLIDCVEGSWEKHREPAALAKCSCDGSWILKDVKYQYKDGEGNRYYSFKYVRLNSSAEEINRLVELLRCYKSVMRYKLTEQEQEEFPLKPYDSWNDLYIIQAHPERESSILRI